MQINKIEIGDNPPHDINVIVEVPVGGSPIKYEFDKKSGAVFVDRFITTPMFYPGNYGFVPHTLSDDGDPLDVLVCNTRAIMPGAIINCRPIGVLVMRDEAGNDEKLLAVPSSRMSTEYECVRHCNDLPQLVIQQIEHFFKHYKDLEDGKWVDIVCWGDLDEAESVIEASIKKAKTTKPENGSSTILRGDTSYHVPTLQTLLRR